MLLAVVPQAAELYTSDDDRLAVSADFAAKGTGLASRNPDDEVLYEDRHSGTGLLRLRFGLGLRWQDWLDAELAYEHSGRYTSFAAADAGAGTVPWCFEQLDWALDEDEHHYWGHEIDRAVIALHPPWGEVTVGRQAIGLGRGTVFGAVDVFSPFSPLEIDREWRRGIDAARAEVRVGATGSAEIIAVGGESGEETALLGRLRGYLGEIDGELIAGRRGEDAMFGVVLSGVVGEAEVHGEAALFETESHDPAYDEAFGRDRLVGVAVLGSSYTFSIGNGVTLLGEYLYNGFGVSDTDDASMRLLNADFAARRARGDFQILGRHAVAVQLSYPIDEAWSATALAVAAPDGSGVFQPSVRWDATQNLSLLAAVYVPWGEEPDKGRLRSEYGGTPLSLFMQLAWYY